MASRPRTQEKTTEQTSFGFRWFKLDADLDEEGSALAFHVLFNTTTEAWQPHTQAASARIRIYSPAVGFTASDGDIVPCYFNPVGRRWEIFNPPSSGMYIAKVPTGGIPARSGLTPGLATVDVFKLDASGDIEDALFDQEINNIYPVSVAFDSAAPYFQIYQDNYGNWFCEAPQIAQFSLLVPFKNLSGFTVPPGGCMGALDTVTIGGIPHVQAYRPGDDPSVPGAKRFDRMWLINAQTAVANGATGLGSWLTDIVGYVALDDSANTPGTRVTWGPRPGSFGLAKDRLGFNPLTAGDFTINGQRCGYFKQHVINDVFGKYYDDLSQGSAALFEIYYRNAAGAIQPAGWDKIQVYDFWLQRDQVVKAGTKGKAHWYAGNWESDLTHCEVSNTDESFPSGQRSAAMGLNNELALALSQTPVSPSLAVVPLTMGLPYGHPI